MATPGPPPAAAVEADVARALAEDIGDGDVTAALLPDRPETAWLLCKEDAVVCGRPWFDACHRALDPDVVIASHEPATTLELALGLGRERRWIADLGDPVLAPYTPGRRQGRSRRIERKVCSQAAAITVTSQGTAALLRDRHHRKHDIHVLTQGFDTGPAEPLQAGVFEAGRLELLYTGSLYAFRRIDALLAAVVSTPGARLSIAGIGIPPHVLSFARAHPEQIRLLGFVPHLTARALQRQSDVLVNLANDDPVQVPGKFYEYLGAGRPILHLGDCADPVGQRMGALRRGWICAQEAGTIAGLLAKLVQAPNGGKRHRPESRSP